MPPAIDAIEVAHGDGLAGSSLNYGFGSHKPITDWIAAAGGCLQIGRG
jgi:4-hydroxy 2-oxovalerate aldolase